MYSIDTPETIKSDIQKILSEKKSEALEEIFNMPKEEQEALRAVIREEINKPQEVYGGLSIAERAYIRRQSESITTRLAAAEGAFDAFEPERVDEGAWSITASFYDWLDNHPIISLVIDLLFALTSATVVADILAVAYYSTRAIRSYQKGETVAMAFDGLSAVCAIFMLIPGAGDTAGAVVQGILRTFGAALRTAGMQAKVLKQVDNLRKAADAGRRASGMTGAWTKTKGWLAGKALSAIRSAYPKATKGLQRLMGRGARASDDIGRYEGNILRDAAKYGEADVEEGGKLLKKLSDELGTTSAADKMTRRQRKAAFGKGGSRMGAVGLAEKIPFAGWIVYFFRRCFGIVADAISMFWGKLAKIIGASDEGARGMAAAASGITMTKEIGYTMGHMHKTLKNADAVIDIGKGISRGDELSLGLHQVLEDDVLKGLYEITRRKSGAPLSAFDAAQPSEIGEQLAKKLLNSKKIKIPDPIAGELPASYMKRVSDLLKKQRAGNADLGNNLLDDIDLLEEFAESGGKISVKVDGMAGIADDGRALPGHIPGYANITDDISFTLFGKTNSIPVPDGRGIPVTALADIRVPGASRIMSADDIIEDAVVNISRETGSKSGALKRDLVNALPKPGREAGSDIGAYLALKYARAGAQVPTAISTSVQIGSERERARRAAAMGYLPDEDLPRARGADGSGIQPSDLDDKGGSSSDGENVGFGRPSEEDKEILKRIRGNR